MIDLYMKNKSWLPILFGLCYPERVSDSSRISLIAVLACYKSTDPVSSDTAASLNYVLILFIQIRYTVALILSIRV